MNMCTGKLKLVDKNKLGRKYVLKCDKCKRLFYRDKLEKNCPFVFAIAEMHISFFDDSKLLFDKKEVKNVTNG